MQGVDLLRDAASFRFFVAVINAFGINRSLKYCVTKFSNHLPLVLEFWGTVFPSMSIRCRLGLRR